MTDEERRRTMEFILEQQAQFAANIEQHKEFFKELKEDRIRDRARRAELQESFRVLVDLCRINDSRLDDLDFKSRTFEEAVRHLDLLMKKNQARLEKLERRKPL